MRAALLGLLLLSKEFEVARQVNRVSNAAPTHTLRIATWNIDHGSNLDAITEELKRSEVSLCALQEVDWNAARSGSKDIADELASRLGMNFSYGVEFQELSQSKDKPAYIGQATLTRLPIRQSRILRFQRQSTFWQPHSWLPSSLPLMQRRLGNRIALITELEFDGKLLVVYNPHLESRSAGAIQTDQMNEMLADMRRYPAETPIVIAGDLNTKYFPSMFLHKLEHEGFHSVLGKRIERTHVIAMALDWIFVRGPFTIDSGEVRRSARGSDHYPIFGQVKEK